uniref:Deoxynucleotidyltransferase, terminal n=1 Tax=Sinocyclocheilus anshuiensis TaxID=1608454 RepID=A0A671R6H4_9TELE
QLPRRRPEVAFTRGHEEVKFRDVTLYLVERRMGKSRRNFLSNLARSKGFLCVCVCVFGSTDVTHVVSEGNAAQELWSWLEEQGFREMHDKHVLHISWFTESMSAGRPVPVQTRHYIQEISECGSSSRVEEILNDERYRTMKLFSSVFGVGLKTAESWFCRGLRTFEQVLSEPSIRLNRMQTAGFLFYEDISKPVSRTEASALKIIVEEAVICVNPSATVSITGGFRR